MASPGDLGEERKIARSVVEELNNSIGRPLGWRIELYGWEDSPIGIVRPQSQINEEVNQCDLFVGMLWERWGHPPGESEYKSGFEEELELARARWARDGRPEIWLFLKEIDPKLLKDPGDQTKLVLAFRQKTKAEQKLFYKEFRETHDWETEFRKRLSYYLVNLAGSRDHSSSPSLSPDRHGDSRIEKLPKERISGTTNRASQQAIDSLNSISHAIKTGALNGLQAQIYPEDIFARLMLVAAAFQASQIEGELLGPHQANTIYRLRSQIVPTKSEWLLLLRTMLANTTQNAPGWAWAPASADIKKLLVHILLNDESDDVVVGILRTLRELNIIPPSRDRRTLFERLLQSKHEPSLVEALHWLEIHGKPADNWFIAQSKDIPSNEVRSAADDAWLAILSRSDVTEACKVLLATEQKISEGVAADLLAKADQTTLVLGVSHKSSVVRKLSAVELKKRDAATKQIAAALIDDADPDVQRVGVQIAISLGERLAFAKIRSTIKPQGLLAAIGGTTADADELILEALKRLPDELLLKGIDWYSPEGHLYYAALSQQHYPTFNARLRSDLADNFTTLLRESSDRMIRQFGTSGQNNVSTYERENLNEFVRKRYLKAALIALAQHGSASDRHLIEPWLDKADSEIALPIAEFLCKHGGDPDVRLILSLYEKSWTNRDSLLPLAVKLATNPSLLLFDRSLNELTRAKLVQHLSDEHILAAKKEWLTLLHHGNADLRKTMILRIFSLTNVTERRKLINALQSHGTYYYDAIYWLDRLSYTSRNWQKLFADSLSKHLTRPYRKDWLRG